MSFQDNYSTTNSSKAYVESENTNVSFKKPINPVYIGNVTPNVSNYSHMTPLSVVGSGGSVPLTISYGANEYGNSSSLSNMYKYAQNLPPSHPHQSTNMMSNGIMSNNVGHNQPGPSNTHPNTRPNTYPNTHPNTNPNTHPHSRLNTHSNTNPNSHVNTHSNIPHNSHSTDPNYADPNLHPNSDLRRSHLGGYSLPFASGRSGYSVEGESTPIQYPNPYQRPLHFQMDPSTSSNINGNNQGQIESQWVNPATVHYTNMINYSEFGSLSNHPPSNYPSIGWSNTNTHRTNAHRSDPLREGPLREGPQHVPPHSHLPSHNGYLQGNVSMSNTPTPNTSIPTSAHASEVRLPTQSFPSVSHPISRFPTNHLVNSTKRPKLSGSLPSTRSPIRPVVKPLTGPLVEGYNLSQHSRNSKKNGSKIVSQSLIPFNQNKYSENNRSDLEQTRSDVKRIEESSRRKEENSKDHGVLQHRTDTKSVGSVVFEQEIMASNSPHTPLAPTPAVSERQPVELSDISTVGERTLIDRNTIGGKLSMSGLTGGKENSTNSELSDKEIGDSNIEIGSDCADFRLDGDHSETLVSTSESSEDVLSPNDQVVMGVEVGDRQLPVIEPLSVGDEENRVNGLDKEDNVESRANTNNSPISHSIENERLNEGRNMDTMSSPGQSRSANTSIPLNSDHSENLLDLSDSTVPDTIAPNTSQSSLVLRGSNMNTYLTPSSNLSSLNNLSNNTQIDSSNCTHLTRPPVLGQEGEGPLSKRVQQWGGLDALNALDALLGDEDLLEEELETNRTDVEDVEVEEKEIVVGERPIVSVVRHNLRAPIGLAYYMPMSKVIYLGETDTLFSLKNMLQQLEPSRVLTHAKAGEPLFDVMRIGQDISIQTMKKSDFNSDLARSGMEQVLAETASVDPTHPYLASAVLSKIDFSKETVVMALGGLLSYLQGTTETLVVRDVKPSTHTELVHCDNLTKHALKVFVSEFHPGGGNRHKEGLSLLSLVNHALTGPGKALIKRWMQFPSADLACLNDRLDHVEYLSKHRELLLEIRFHLGKVRDIPRLMIRFSSVVVRTTDWISLLQSLHHLVALNSLIQAHILQTNSTVPRLLTAFVHSVTTEIAESSQILSELINVALTSSEGKLRVNSGFDPEVDRARQTNDILYLTLSELVEEDLLNGRIVRLPREMKYVFFQHIGYMLAVQYSEDEPLDDLPNTEFKFRSGKAAFFTNATTATMNDEIGDVLTLIYEAEKRVSERVMGQVLVFRESIESCARLAYELDAVCSFALTALDLEHVRPVLTSEKVLHLVDAKHPLLDVHQKESVVTNTVKLDENNGIINVITGPNNSGKSILLETVGMLTYLAHVGCFIPVSSAVIGICDMILCQVPSIDSIGSRMSTFTSDVAHMGLLLNNSKHHSLLLVDEFGTGTNTVDGIALCAATIRYLDSLGKKCPKMLISTHFHEIYTYQLVRESLKVRFFSMQCVPDSSEHRLNSKQGRRSVYGIVYLYKCLPGWTTSSHGFECAYGAGMPMHILARASEIKNHLNNHTNIEPIKLLSGQIDGKIEKNKYLLRDALNLGKELRIDPKDIKSKITKFIEDINSKSIIKE